MNKLHIFQTLLAVFLLARLTTACNASCSLTPAPFSRGESSQPAQESMALPQPPSPSLPSPTSTHTPVLTPTRTPIPPTPTATPTPKRPVSPTISLLPTDIRTATEIALPVINASAGVKVRCLEVLPALPADTLSTGYLILNGYVEMPDGKGGLKGFSINMINREKTPIGQENEGQHTFAVSPDRKWVAFHQFTRPANEEQGSMMHIVITTVENRRQNIITKDMADGFVVAWLDNQRLVIGVSVEEQDRASMSASWTGMNFLIINPFTNEHFILEPDLPGLHFEPLAIGWDGWYATVYDPFLERLVYSEGADGIHSPYHLVLWDVVKRQSLSEYPIIGDFGSTPRWSPDGQKFAFALSLLPENDLREKWPAYEIYLVGRDGKASQLTNLASTYPWSYISNLSWSPDGHHIAFWFSTYDEKPELDTGGEQQLGVVDTTSGETANYCIPGDFDADIAGRRLVPPPLWSPDSKQLVKLNRYSEEHNRSILVDLETGIAAQIAEDMEPVGWMTNP